MFTPEQIAKASKASLDFYLRNNPIDQISQDRPLLDFLSAGKKSFPGGKQYVVEQLRKSYDSNFQWYRGDTSVTYNSRDPLAQAQYPWSGWHDGYGIDEDEMLQNGIILTDDRSAKASDAEVVQLTNMLEEYNVALREGAREKFDYELHLDGTQNSEAVAGLDYLISTTPTSGVVGGIDRSTYPWWQNNVKTGITASTDGALLAGLEEMHRACTKNGGKPTKIFCGAAFLDSYRKNCKSEIERHVVIGGKGGTDMDGAVNDLYFKGIPLVWDPTFEDLDANLSPSIDWSKRAYMLNKRWIRLRPAEGHDMLSRKPSRVYDRYVHYQGLTWKGALTMGRANAHAVLSIS